MTILKVMTDNKEVATKKPKKTKPPIKKTQ